MRPIRFPRDGAPVLDIWSYARGTPDTGHPLRLTPAQIDHVRRTVMHAPEVMVKVTGGGGASSSRGIKAHFSYVCRRGELEIETDDGERLKGRDAGLRLLEDWNLDLDEHRKRPDLFATSRRQAPKLVHRLIFSMPAGTPPDKVLSAVRDFAREEFGLKHRYAMVLHTDEPHPHVHVVVKAMSEDGLRLNVRKATLRAWRLEFARHLRQHGVEANATERAVRGKVSRSKKDGIYRAALRGESTHMQRRFEEAMGSLAERRLPAEPGKKTLIEARRNVERGWRAVSQSLGAQGEQTLAESVDRFVEKMRLPRTDRELMIEQLLERAKRRERVLTPTR
jgi:hypothetical protein